MEKKKKIVLAAVSVLAILLIVEVAGFYLGSRTLSRSNAAAALDKAGAKKSLGQMKARNAALKHKLRSFNPKSSYIVVDTARNILSLRRGDKILREAVVSSGSGSILKDPGGEKKWVFDTPRGEFAVISKKVDPVWTKPDWAFIEEGEEIPRNFRDRLESEVLGDYAMGFGNGYFIHGTLYTRLLGRNVTHGCIRVGDEDLKAVFTAAPVGTKIFIY